MFQMEAEAVNATSDKLENDTHAALEAIIEFQNVSIHSEVTSETALNAWGRVYQLERYVTRAQASVEAARATLNENSHSSREASDAQSALISALHRAELAITAAQGIQARYMAVDAAFRNAGGEFPDEPARHEWVEGHQN
jgi:hypothetical protein